MHPGRPLLLASLLCLVGCSQPDIAGRTWICATDADCGSGFFCFAGLCRPKGWLADGASTPADADADQPSLPHFDMHDQDLPDLSDAETASVDVDLTDAETDVDADLPWLPPFDLYDQDLPNLTDAETLDMADHRDADMRLPDADPPPEVHLPDQEQVIADDIDLRPEALPDRSEVDMALPETLDLEAEAVDSDAAPDTAPCPDPCETLAAARCGDGGLSECVDRGDGCWTWSEPVPCQDDDPCTADETCVDGACVAREACCTDDADNDIDEATDCDDEDCRDNDACIPVCEDLDGDGYRAGDGCQPADCDDTVAVCNADCTADADGDMLRDCDDPCIDADDDGYGASNLGAEGECAGPDCDDTSDLCVVECKDDDDDGTPDCRDDCLDKDHDGYGDGLGCVGTDCMEGQYFCNTQCVDADQNGHADCEELCIDADGDTYCVNAPFEPDCDDNAPSCYNGFAHNCEDDRDGDEQRDCDDPCIDPDGDGFGTSLLPSSNCLGPDCDEAHPTCTFDCDTNVDLDAFADCRDGCIDRDGDGYGDGTAFGDTCDGPDCNDDAAAVNSARAERCNGIDDDCDGQTDAGDSDLSQDDPRTCENAIGLCAGTPKPVSLCVVGQWQPCGPAQYQAHSPYFENDEELTCDNRDNDCDGQTDEDFALTDLDGSTKTKGQSCGTGLCLGGTVRCNDEPQQGPLTCSSWVNIQDEICNEVDDDCDGLTDDDLTLVDWDGTLRTKGQACGTGGCVGGNVQCDADQIIMTCTTWDRMQGESCNEIDDDCDGQTDEAEVSVDDPQLCENQEGVCQDALKTGQLCQGGLWQPCQALQYQQNSEHFDNGNEIHCDEMDNDCDGLTDEDFQAIEPNGATVRHIGDECGFGVCQNGRAVCNSMGTGLICTTWTSIGPEICNNLDDDCNGETDASDTSLMLPTCENQIGVCTGCRKPADLCVDGAWGTCTEAIYQACAPLATFPTETCNNRDDDCDGQTDAIDTSLSLPLCENQDGVCAGSTKIPVLCSDGSWQPCGPEQYQGQDSGFQQGVELSCDDRDNDCDGQTDDDFTFRDWNGALRTKGQSCGTGRCANGIVVCNAATDDVTCSTLSNAQSEICNNEDDDCDGLIDKFDSSLYRPPCEIQTGGCAGCMKPSMLCQGGIWQACTPTVYQACAPGSTFPNETCNNLDDDCDGQIDSADANMILPHCELSAGACASCQKQATLCINGSWGACTIAMYQECSPYYEYAEVTCDDNPGRDNDCDGVANCADPDCNGRLCSFSCSGSCHIAQSFCEASQCNLGLCEDGYRNCNSNQYDGCETSIGTDVDNCGDCGRQCSTSKTDVRHCSGGVCDSSCNFSWKNCTRPPAPAPDDGCETFGAVCW